MLGVKITLGMLCSVGEIESRKFVTLAVKEPPVKASRGQDRSPVLGGKPAEFASCGKLWRYSAAPGTSPGLEPIDRRRCRGALLSPIQLHAACTSCRKKRLPRPSNLQN